MSAIYEMLKRKGACDSEASQFRRMSYARAYRRACRNPYYMGWFLQNFVAAYYSSPEYELAIRLMRSKYDRYENRKSLRKSDMARGRKLLREWARDHHIKL